MILNVEDANDEYPTFVRDEYLISVLDRTPIGSYVSCLYTFDRISDIIIFIFSRQNIISGLFDLRKGSKFEQRLTN